MREVTQPNSKTYYIATAIKTTWHQQRKKTHRPVEQNRKPNYSPTQEKPIDF